MHPSSPLPPARHTRTLDEQGRVPDPWCADATTLLHGLPDHRAARGQRHSLGYLHCIQLAAACTTGFAGIVGAARWAATAPAGLLVGLGARRDAAGQVRRPSVRTLGRVAAQTPPAHLQAGIEDFTATASVSRLPTTTTGTTGTAGTTGALRGVAMDGKAVNGARSARTPAPFLVAVVTHATATCAPVVLAQRAVGAAHLNPPTSTDTTEGGAEGGSGPVVGKKGEAPTGRELLGAMDLSGCVVTADAGHTYAATAAAVRAAGGHYLFVVKGNQPHLLTFAEQVLSGRDADFPNRAVDGAPCPTSGTVAHGRREQRLLRAVEVNGEQLAAAGVAFGAGEGGVGGVDVAQVARLTRRRRQVRAGDDRPGGWDSKEVVYLVTSLSAAQADAGTLLALARGHWSVEVVHHVRDTSYGEDACRVTTASAAVNLAAWRNLSILLVRLAGGTVKATLTWANAAHANAVALLRGRAPAVVT